MTTKRIILTIPAELLALLDACRPKAQSRAGWIREAIRRRVQAENPVRLD